MMSNQKQPLLRVEPHDKRTLRPDHENKGLPSCRIRLSNKSQFLVAFKVRTTDTNKFEGGPGYGILKPGSFCYVEVNVVGQVEAPSNRKYGDKVTIKALVASRDDTEESLPTLFKVRAAMVEDYELRVMYDLPLHQQSSNSGTSVAGSSRNASALQKSRRVAEQARVFFLFRNFESVAHHLGRRRRNHWDSWQNGIMVVFSCYIFWYLMVQILSRLWAMIYLIMILALKLMRNAAVEAAEDWIKRTLVYICLYILAAFREKLLGLCLRWLNVVSNAFVDLVTAVFGLQERQRRRPSYRN